MSKYFSFIALLVVIILVAILFYKVMAGFFVPLFLAALLVVIFRPMHNWIVDRCKGREKLAAVLTTASVLLAVLLPLAALFVLAAFESQQVLKKFDKTTILNTVETTRRKLKLKMPAIADDLNAVQIQLDNIAETERLEEIANLGWQMQTTELFNEELAVQLKNADDSVDDTWNTYLESFEQLAALQMKMLCRKVNSKRTLRKNRVPNLKPNGSARRSCYMTFSFSSPKPRRISLI